MEKPLPPGDCQKSIFLWDLQSGARLEEYTGHSHSIESLAISPDGKLLASASEDETIRIWDIKSGELLVTCYTLYEGFLWNTPPDELAPNGWLYTDRPDLVSLYEVENSDAAQPEYIYEEDERFQAFMQLYNDREMVFQAFK